MAADIDVTILAVIELAAELVAGRATADPDGAAAGHYTAAYSHLSDAVLIVRCVAENPADATDRG